MPSILSAEITQGRRPVTAPPVIPSIPSQRHPGDGCGNQAVSLSLHEGIVIAYWRSGDSLLP